MENVLRCDCGFEVRAVDEAEFITRVQRHASDAHGMRLSRDDVLRLAAPADLGKASSQPRRESEIQVDAS
jgi:hypothetical protein